jgi:membrane protein implicated in regulation of membrane protease activity
METWWQGLTVLNKGFAVSAFFFSLLFLWQLAAALVGGNGDSHGDAGHAAANHPAGDHAGEHGVGSAGGPIAFSLVSVRSLIAFGMLFSWAGTLYLMTGSSIVPAIVYSAVWGLVAMVAVSYLVYHLVRLQETGTSSIWSAIGEEGAVYMNIPEGGCGKVRVMVSGAISFVKARAAGGRPILAGTKVRVVGVIDDTTIEVEPTENGKGI